MSGILDMVTGSLEPTATYQRRDWIWIPAAPGVYDDDRIGSLTILLQKGKGGNCKPEVDTYGVQEDLHTDRPAGARVFLLRNDTDPDQPDVYACTVGADHRGEIHQRCTCRAGENGKACKHTAALLAMIEEGLFDADL